MTLFILTLKSILHRRSTALLVIFAIAVSITLLIGIERLRNEARLSFANTISGTDLIVGARGGTIQLLLYSVFRIGNPTNTISWRSYKQISERKEVAWRVPISLGDSHRGFRVMGTTTDYFKYVKTGPKRSLQVEEGAIFDDLFDAVIGGAVAEQLGYKVGDKIVIAHGISDAAISDHADKPFRVSGILRKTGTPVDRTVLVSLEAIEAIHLGWQQGVRATGLDVSAAEARQMQLVPRRISAFMIGLKSKFAIFSMQRAVNDYSREPLMAILPGATLQELWDMIGSVETLLLLISVFVVVAGLIAMMTVLMAGLNERRREIAVFRALGASASDVFFLLVFETLLLTAAGILLGLALIYALLFVAQPMIDAQFGLLIAIRMISLQEIQMLFVALLAGGAVGIIPGLIAYRNSVADGITARN